MALYRSGIERQVGSTSKMYARIARIYGRQGMVDAAIQAYELSLESDPTSIETQEELAVAYMLRGRTAEAERIFKGILVLDEANAKAHNGLGWIVLKKREIPKAREHFEKALQLDPDLIDAYINLGMLCKDTGDLDGARRSFETFLSKASKMDYQGSIRTAQRELAAIAKMQRSVVNKIWLGTLVPLARLQLPSVGQAFEPDGLTLRGSGVRLESLTYRGSGPANRIPLKLILRQVPEQA